MTNIETLMREMEAKINSLQSEKDTLQASNEALKERVKQLEQLECSFYMDICRAYNAGKQCMSNQHEDARNGKEFNTRFVSSHNYFVGEFPTFKTNVP